MKKSQLVSTMCAFSIAVLANTTQAAVVTGLSNLDIDGTSYDVTFHIGKTFNELWDGDGDQAFGDDGSEFSSQPTFWGNGIGATAAANAIIAALGTTDGISLTSDGFQVPYQFPSLTQTTSCVDFTLSYTSETQSCTFLNVTGELSNVPNWPYASFATSAVPVPAAAWLFGSALLGLVAVKRKKA